MSVKCSRCGNENPDVARFCNICGSPIGRPSEEQELAAPVRCLKCGAMNSSALKMCGLCRSDLTESIKVAMNPESEKPPMGTRQCLACGRQIDPAANVCPYCGLDFVTMSHKERTPVSQKPTYAAILMAGAGVLALFVTFYNLSYQELPSELVPYQGMVELCSMVVVVLAVISIIGAYFAYRRQYFVFAIIGAIAAMMTLGVYVGFFMGLIALILLAISQGEFEGRRGF